MPGVRKTEHSYNFQVGTLTFYKLWSYILYSDFGYFPTTRDWIELDIFLEFEEITYYIVWLIGEINRRQFVLSLESQTVATMTCHLRWGRCQPQDSGWQELTTLPMKGGRLWKHWLPICCDLKTHFSSALDVHLSFSNKIKLHILLLMPCIIFSANISMFNDWYIVIFLTCAALSYELFFISHSWTAYFRECNLL